MIFCFKKGSKKLIEKAKQFGTCFVRDFEGLDVGIRYWIWHYGDGLLFYYENKSRIYRLSEDIIFKLDYCYIEGIPGNIVTFVLGPQEN